MSTDPGSAIHVRVRARDGAGRRPPLLVRPPAVQRKAAGERSPQTPDGVDDVLRSPGRSLPGPTASFMAERFGQDFSGVRVHNDGAAAESARRLDAHAYTVGNHIAFAPGRFSPASAAGQRLLAHELTHVVQQGGHQGGQGGQGGGAVALPVSRPGDALEGQADRAAEAAVSGRSVGRIDPLGGAAIQRQPATPGLPPLTGLALPLASVEIEAGDSITKENPKLVSFAQQAKSASASVSLSAYFSERVKYNTAGEKAERSQIVERMYRIRDVLVALGVAADRIDLSPPTGYSTSAHGQVSASARGSTAAPLPGVGPPPGPAPGPKPVLPGPQPGPAPATKGPSLGDMLTVKFGPVTVELPASIKAKLPLALTAGKTLVIGLSFDAPAKFAFNITLDGTPSVRVSVGASAQYDPDKKSAMGSAGLTIESLKTTCHATNSEELKAKLKEAGDKFGKAAKEFGETADAETRLKKLADIAGAIASMYDAVEKAKAGCKQVPGIKFEFGTRFPITPGQETDPRKTAPFVGGTVTVPF